jgi:hypothetical protein
VSRFEDRERALVRHRASPLVGIDHHGSKRSLPETRSDEHGSSVWRGVRYEVADGSLLTSAQDVARELDLFP